MILYIVYKERQAQNKQWENKQSAELLLISFFLLSIITAGSYHYQKNDFRRSSSVTIMQEKNYCKERSDIFEILMKAMIKKNFQ
jgi:hypothetical protein